MDATCTICEREIAAGFMWGNLKESDHMED